MAVITVRGWMNDRVLSKSHVHLGKERETVEDLGVVFAPGPGQARFHVIQSDPYHVVLDVTDEIRILLFRHPQVKSQ